MLKILSSDQIKRVEKDSDIDSLKLMKKAGEKASQWILEHLSKADLEKHPLLVFCGIGNNGGDGLVIAEELISKKYKVEVFIVEFSQNYSRECQYYLDKIKRLTKVHVIDDERVIPKVKPDQVVIDAIFGLGLNKPIQGFLNELIDEINRSQHIISIDVPSGLLDDQHQTSPGAIINARHTLSFQFPKFSFFLSEYESYVGTWVLLDIGLNSNNINSDFLVTQIDDIRSHRLKISSFAYKYKFGHACLIAGSKGKMGAAILSAKACFRSGVGLVTTHIPSSGALSMYTSVPEVMILEDKNLEMLTEYKKYDRFSAIGIGPGIALADETQRILKQIIQNTPHPLVLDADALNILAENRTWISFLPAHSILTPHHREFERLIGEKFTLDEERLQQAKTFAIKYGLILVLKGKYTAVCAPDGKVYFNTTGNVGMAKAGSGDVLTGILTSLLAQGYDPLWAAIAGAYIHGLAGDFAKEVIGEKSLLASDIIEHLPNAFQFIEGK